MGPEARRTIWSYEVYCSGSGEINKKKWTEEALKKMGELLLRGTTEVARSTTIATLGARIDIEPVQKSIIVQAAKPYHWIHDAHRVKSLEEVRRRQP